MDFNSAKEYINQQEPTFLARAKHGYICPACKQGQNKGQGITRATGRPHLWHCIACERERSVTGLFAIHSGIPDDRDHFPEIVRRAADYYGITIDQDRPGRATAKEDFADMGEYQNQTKNERKAAPEGRYTSFYRECASHLLETDYYKRRGLSLETCKRYNVGFSPAWKHPNAPQQAPATPRLIIPITPDNYLARDTRAEIPAAQEEYKKSKCKNPDRESVSWTFNADCLRKAEKPIFVVEGEIDALSIIEAGGEAVAIGSTAYINRFGKELEALPPAQPLLIALDDDNAGEQAARKLETKLEGLGIPCYRYNPAKGYKDANEMLIADPERLKANVAKASSLERLQELELEERREAYMQNSAASHLQAFIDGITDSVNTPYIPTGFPKLDGLLEGGLYEGLYICGAISSLGKTTLVVQIADQIAQAGTDVLYFSLEMARSEIMAKSISRHTLQEIIQNGGDIRNAKTTRGITTGTRYQNYSKTELELIQTAISNYSSYAERIFITEGVGDIGAAQVRETVEEHISITGRTPVVVIDYLQILAPYNDRATDKQNTDKAVLELKRISRDYKTPVIAISSFNRENYSATVRMQAFKESGAVEYSADTLIGLQLAGAGEKGFDVDGAKKKDPREVELVILKNRNGKTGDKLEYKYYPMFNLFEEQ